MKSYYEIYNFRDKRLKTKKIVISHATNTFQTGSYLLPIVREGARNHYTWGKWQEYYYEELKKKKLPNHYFVEELENDWVINVGLPSVEPSYFLQELADAKAIPFQYRDALFITIGFDFSIFPMPDRMAEQMCDKLLSPLLYQHKMDFLDVVYLDDVLSAGWKTLMQSSGLKYEITPQKYFDINTLYMTLNNYKKN